MTLKKKTLMTTGTSLALSSLVVFSHSVDAQASAWQARTEDQIRADHQASGQENAYEVQWGDTLGVISRALQVPLDKLVEINEIENQDLIQTGQVLRVLKAEDRLEVETKDGEVKVYDLETAEQVSVEPAEEKNQEVLSPQAVQVESEPLAAHVPASPQPVQANDLTSDEVAVKEEVQGPVLSEVEEEAPIRVQPQAVEVDAVTLETEEVVDQAIDTTQAYQVQAGDSLSEIAERSGLVLEDLLAYNGIEDPNLLTVGQELVFWQPEVQIQSEAVQVEMPAVSETVEEVAEEPLVEEVVEQVEEVVEPVAEAEPVAEPAPQALQIDPSSPYTVQAGDTLAEIAQAVGISVSKLASINGISNPAAIQVGQTISFTEPEPEPEPEVEVAAEPMPQAVSISEGPQAPAPARQAPRGDVLSIGSQYIGTPYLWAGTSPAGFDCSGFTQYVFANAGKNIPRTAQAQYNASVKVSNPQPGDLVFFSHDGGASVGHVGIYAGNGQFLGSQSYPGVSYASVNDSYWGPRVVGYGRY